jgi:hypothetical protein
MLDVGVAVMKARTVAASDALENMVQPPGSSPPDPLAVEIGAHVVVWVTTVDPPVGEVDRLGLLADTAVNQVSIGGAE